ncbi:SGNH/GDSL hydrolase family protein [Stieleria sp. TO1_6]|uniref:SGNH/GDSL hydrolase family protein n=1 Tax=Stieleria tagensis TaxID=2956795 RepID=UPI00209B0CB7|nr:SGNH/GDSL hydrolase family protein [Stieleria tagensis]MCO8122516.1 SGNH/GDSL hydrolase family protein [Stieleria tagensis]
MHHRISAFFFVVLAALTTQVAAQPPYDSIVVFGDSLSDTGNAFAATGIPPTGPGDFPYYQGRFSNGPVWIDYLQSDLGLADQQILNFAVGGASTGEGFREPPSGIFDGAPGAVVPTVGAQIETFLQVAAPTQNQLTILWAGSNDLLNRTLPIVAVYNVENHIRKLADAGADEFLVPSLSPLGTTPAVNQSFEGLILNGMAWRFNSLLDRRLDKLEAELEIKIHRLDTFTLTYLGIIFPTAFGLTNTSNAALTDIQSNLISPHQGASYLYWDIIHPTSQAHRIIADATLLKLSSQ